jgi:hypothetical protein
VADLLVRIRISGAARAVAVTAERLRMVLSVAIESTDYPNHRDPGVRRYIDVLIDGADLLAEEARRRG